MRLAVLTLPVLGVVLLLTACGADDTAETVAPSSPAATTSPSDATSFGDPALAGLCEDATLEIAADEPGSATPEEAIDGFVTTNSVLEPTTISGYEIRFGGEVVGQITVSEAPAGGYYVESAEWCHPD